MMDSGLLKDIIEWDVKSWAQALPFWESSLPKAGRALELGARRGGLSLWLAKKGFQVVCSDYDADWNQARALHAKYGVLQHISYEHINALNIPYENHFDLIAFKSILGGVTRGGRPDRQAQAFDAIYRALKPGGVLIFAENLEASQLHQYTRKYFVQWGNDWNYLKYDEVSGLLSDFEKVELKTVGFFAAFGRSEWQRRRLAHLDQLIHFAIPQSKRYIILVRASKPIISP